LVKAKTVDGLVVSPTQPPVERQVPPDAVLGKVVRVETPAELLPVLRVDGNPVSPHAVWIHHQRDPYPGGHRYQWRIPVLLIEPKVFDYAKLKTCTMPDEDTSSHWLFWLGSILAHWSRLIATERGDESPDGLQFVLNTIEDLTVTESDVTVTGVCSPFVRAGSRTYRCSGPATRLTASRAAAPLPA
jgi:hypothetical protein